MSRSDRSHGCDVTNRRRGIAGRPVGRAQAVDRPQQLGEVGPPVEVELPAAPAFGVDVAEARLGREVVAVGVDVLAEQRDLAVARRGEGPGLGHDLVEGPAPLGPATERHDAVGAGLVAAVDDRQPGADRRGAMHAARDDGRGARIGQSIRRADHGPTDEGRQPDRPGRGRQARRSGRRIVRVGSRDQPDRPLGRRQPQPVDELRLLVGAQEQVHGGIAASQTGPVGFADGAAGQHDPQRGVGALERGQVALPADDLLFGRLADGAGVDHDQVGRVEGRRLGAARRQQPPGHLLRVAAVHLAAEGPDEEARQDLVLRPELREPRIGGDDGRPRPDGHGRRHEVQDRQDAAGRAFDHRFSRRSIMASALGRSLAGRGLSGSAACSRSPTSAGTQRAAWASA